MSEFNALKKAVKKLSESIAKFPVGAISLNELKPTEEKIQDLRVILKRINSSILVLRAKKEALAMPNVPEQSLDETYDQLQEQVAHCTINQQTIESCLYSDAIEPILQNTEDTEVKRNLQDLMQELFTVNDMLLNSEEVRWKVKEKERELTIELKESLLEFKDFLKEQEAIRNTKLQETNPNIAEKKKKMQKRVQKLNVMKRMITNMIAASGEFIAENPFFQEMLLKHRDLVDPEMIAKMALEIPEKEPQ